VVDGEGVAKNVNVNVESKRREIRALSLDFVVVSRWKSARDFFWLGSDQLGRRHGCHLGHAVEHEITERTEAEGPGFSTALASPSVKAFMAYEFDD